MPHARRAVVPLLLAALAALVALALTACSSEPAQGENTDPAQVDAVEVPELGACRVLTPADVAQASNATRTVDCADKHTAQTYAVGPLPDQFEEADYDDGAIGAWAYDACSKKFMGFLGADESLVMRSLVSWAWFRPSEKAWNEGARWYRCDVVGGGDQEGYDGASRGRHGHSSVDRAGTSAIVPPGLRGAVRRDGAGLDETVRGTLTC